MSPTLPTPRGALPQFLRLGASSRGRLKRFAAAAAALSFGVWMWQWLSTDEKGEPIAAKSEEPALQIENLTSFLVRRDGLPLWEISAKRVEVASDESSTTATGVGRGTLFRAGKPFLKLSAPRVKLSNPNSDLEASGGVAASGPDRFSFQTSRALWHSQAQIVECPRAVTAWLRDLWFSAPLLSYNWKDGLLSCPQPVEVRGDGFVMRGKNLDATLKTRQIRMSGGVHIVVAARRLPQQLIATLSHSQSPTPQNN